MTSKVYHRMPGVVKMEVKRCLVVELMGLHHLLKVSRLPMVWPLDKGGSPQLKH